MQSKSPQELTQARLRELLDYEPETGVFTRRTGRGGRAAGTVAGYKGNNGYVYVSVDGGRPLAHRLAFLWMTGAWPEHEVDHIDGVCTNNQWSNLREANSTDNKHNRGRANRNNKVGLLGVSWSKHTSKWLAVIMVARKQHHLGLFPTPELAHAAYLKAKDELHPTHMRLRNHGR